MLCTHVNLALRLFNWQRRIRFSCLIDRIIVSLKPRSYNVRKLNVSQKPRLTAFDTEAQECKDRLTFVSQVIRKFRN